MKLKAAGNLTFLWQFIEWAKTGDLGTAAELSSTDDTASYFQGAYASASGPFLNPWVRAGPLESGGTSTLQSAVSWN